MSDIFISYAKDDRSILEPLAKALTEYGWTVFWDPSIPAGQTWRQVIGNEIETARCVVVAWSGNSNNSHWVLEESEIGRERGVLIPILIEDVMPPIGFRSLQAANISHWDGKLSDPNFQSLISDLTSVLGEPPASPGTEKVRVPTKKTGIGAQSHQPQKYSQQSSKPTSGEEKPDLSKMKYILIGSMVLVVAAFLTYWFGLRGTNYSSEEDQAAWISALESNRPEGFLNYLDNFPDGQYVQNAEFLMDSLNEVFAWREAVEGNTIESYKAFKKRWPEGRFTDEANKALEKLLDDERRSRQILSASTEGEVWKNALKQNTLAAYRAYQERYPGGEFFSEAERKIVEIQSSERRTRTDYEDRRAWKAALDAGTIVSLQKYKKDYPEGIYFEEASARLNELNDNIGKSRIQPLSSQVLQINGRNVKAVSFGSSKDEILGEFVMKGNKNWIETGANGEARFQFKEIERDEWSVYLSDVGRDVRIQLDLHSRKVMYGQADEPWVHLYTIFGAK